MTTPPTEVRRGPTCAHGAAWWPPLPSTLPSLSGPSTSRFQPSDVPLVLPDAAPLGAVDEQGLRVGRQLVQLDLERVGVVLDEAPERRSCSTLDLLTPCSALASAESTHRP